MSTAIVSARSRCRRQGTASRNAGGMSKSRCTAGGVADRRARPVVRTRAGSAGIERRAVALVLVLGGVGAAQGAAPAAAQSADLGELRISIAERTPPASTLLMLQPDVPSVPDTDLPPAAVSLHTRWSTARRAYVEAVDRRNAAATDEERARIAATVPALDRAHVAARDALLESLRGAGGALSRPALLLLGMLQHRVALEAFAHELDAFDACEAAGRADCPAAGLDDAEALATWTRVEGDDVLAAHALYQRAEALDVGGDPDAARPLLEAALRITALPPELEAAAALLLGAVASPDDVEAVAASYGRCASVAAGEVSARCAVMAGLRLWVIGEDAAALAALAPVLGHALVHDDAVEIAAAVLRRVGRGAPEHLPESVAAADRAAVLDRAATLLGDDGHLAWSVAALAAAQALAPEPARAERIAALEAARASSTESAEAWLRRAIGFCLERDPEPMTFTIRVRLAAAPTVRLTAGTGSRARSRALSTCLEQHAPPPEARLRGAVSAHVSVTLE